MSQAHAAGGYSHMKLEEYLSHPVVPFIGRLCIVYVYTTSGYAKIVGWEGNVQY